ncbi:MAG TPA: DciA family protein [Rhodanobacteraceae bacterium]|nr:DciA family protein [Rhodanobacteraceae bacterium]
MNLSPVQPPRDTCGPTPLSQCAPVADLAARARDVDRLSQRIVPVLPVPLREHVWHAGLRNDRVLLLVESPAWATRVRMDQSRILAAIHSLGLAATSVTATVVPLPIPPADSATPCTLSSRAAETIRAAATAITDPELRALFLELAGQSTTPAAP